MNESIPRGPIGPESGSDPAGERLEDVLAAFPELAGPDHSPVDPIQPDPTEQAAQASETAAARANVAAAFDGADDTEPIPAIPSRTSTTIFPTSPTTPVMYTQPPRRQGVVAGVLGRLFKRLKCRRVEQQAPTADEQAPEGLGGFSWSEEPTEEKPTVSEIEEGFLPDDPTAVQGRDPFSAPQDGVSENNTVESRSENAQGLQELHELIDKRFSGRLGYFEEARAEEHGNTARGFSDEGIARIFGHEVRVAIVSSELGTTEKKVADQKRRERSGDKSVRIAARKYALEATDHSTITTFPIVGQLERIRNGDRVTASIEEVADIFHQASEIIGRLRESRGNRLQRERLNLCHETTTRAIFETVAAPIAPILIDRDGKVNTSSLTSSQKRYLSYIDPENIKKLRSNALELAEIKSRSSNLRQFERERQVSVVHGALRAGNYKLLDSELMAAYFGILAEDWESQKSGANMVIPEEVIIAFASLFSLKLATLDTFDRVIGNLDSDNTDKLIHRMDHLIVNAQTLPLR